CLVCLLVFFFFFFQAEDGIRDKLVTGVQTCALPILGLGMSALLAPAVVVRDRQALTREWRDNWRTIVVASSMNLTSYLLVLFAFRLSKVGYVVAARELSILFSTFIGSLWLGEGRLLPRLAGASIVLAGVVCVALAH